MRYSGCNGANRSFFSKTLSSLIGEDRHEKAEENTSLDEALFSVR